MTRIIVAAIDFGTAFSGWAFSFKHDFDKDPTKIETKNWHGGDKISQKGPTTVLIHPDGERIHSFGYDAEDKYADLSAQDDNEHEKWFLFKNFKMELFTEKGLSRDLMLEDAFGKKLSAKTVFGLSIKYLKDDLLSISKSRVTGVVDNDIHWVLTVPAIWNDAAKQFMREAAHWADIPNERLTIALEPECASIYCRRMPLDKAEQSSSPMAFSAGSKYMILDAGGGTIDITVHEVTENGDLRELCKASGGAWGGTRVDSAFRTFLDELFGRDVMVTFKKQEMEDYIALFRDFELKKRKVEPDINKQVTIKVPLSLFTVYKQEKRRTFEDDFSQTKFASKVKISSDKLRIKGNIIQDLFAESIRGTLDEVAKLLQQRPVAGCSTIVMVGGFSESDIYKDAVKKRFSRLNVVVPQDAGLAVLKGAVIFGHLPTAVCERVVRFTYGTSLTHKYVATCSHPVGKREIDENGKMRCYDNFDIHASIGTKVTIGRKQKEHLIHPITDDQTTITLDIYASTKEDPQLVTEEGCMKIGTITTTVTDCGREKEFGYAMMFGGTEVEVSAVEKSTGKVSKATVNLLG